MEEAWKQSSVALGFQEVLISICSSEPEGSKKRRESLKKVFAGEDHEQISGFFSAWTHTFYSSITLASLIFEAIRWFLIMYIMTGWRVKGQPRQSCLNQSSPRASLLSPNLLLSSLVNILWSETMEASVTLLQYLWLTVFSCFYKTRAMKDNTWKTKPYFLILWLYLMRQREACLFWISFSDQLVRNPRNAFLASGLLLC